MPTHPPVVANYSNISPPYETNSDKFTENYTKSEQTNLRNFIARPPPPPLLVLGLGLEI